ncbi:MAG: hypothetical protein ACN4GM_01020 [Gammaproteobacteria bacterium]
MKLNIPEQTTAGKDDFPNHPRKIKKWLAGLPQTNMGEYTRTVYKGITQLNRQSMPPKQRLENMELLREPVRQILKQLHKHFVNRSLPLPDKSLKIITLNQAILGEMAIGYKIIVFEAANGLNRVDNKSLLFSSERALHYLDELLLRASQVYSLLPKGLWWDIHHIYAYVESKKLQRKKIKDQELAQTKITIEDYYKQILLFSLARPNALRQSDAERVHRGLAGWAKLTTLSAKPSKNKLSRYFCSLLDSDAPPNSVSEEDLHNLKNFRSLDLDKLVKSLRVKVGVRTEPGNKVSVDEEISQETLKTLISSWSMWAKRRFSRAVKQTDIKVAIGMGAIYTALKEQQTRREPKSPKKLSSMFSLGAISDSNRADRDHQGKNNPDFFITHPDMKANEISGSTAWDMVSKGRALTEGYTKELHRSDAEMGKLNKDAPDLYWAITNVSAGGYCLHWDSPSASRAQVGELIAIRERLDNTYHWRIGVIRWMQYARDKGLEIGVQVLAPEVMACTVRRPERKDETPFECLLLPEVKPVQQPSTLLMPAYAFRKGNMLKIHVQNQDMEINLGTIREHTGSFTQFQFTLANGPGNSGDDKSRSSNPDDFDSIWSSI